MTRKAPLPYRGRGALTAGSFGCWRGFRRGFRLGAFSFSHGLEAAVEGGCVDGRCSLQQWIGAVVAFGSGRIDADILRDAYRAAVAGDIDGADPG